MSTTMYCYKVEKNKIWDVIKEIKNFYKKNGIGYKIVDILSSNIKDNKIEFYEAYKLLETDELIVNLQLFERDDCFIFRILEQGYFFMNNFSLFEISEVFYDDRTDIPTEHKKNKKIAEWMDKKINEELYFICPIVSSHSLKNRLISLGKQ